MYLAVKVGENCHAKQVAGNHEPEVIKWINENVKPDMTIVDIGANNGYLSYYFSKAVGKDGEVICVEADPNNYFLLEETIQMNEIWNCSPFSEAIHNYIGHVKFGISDKCTWSGISPMTDCELINVPCETVDSLCEEYENIDIIKIDVEGTEFAVLQGAEQTIVDFSPTFLVELHGTDEEEKNHPVLKFFVEHGYSIEYLVYPWFIVAKKI